MKAQVSVTVAALAGFAVLAASAHGAPAAGEAAAGKGVPRIDQMIVFRSGAVVTKRVLAERTTASVGRRDCTVAAATPLAALLAARPGPIAYHDYGSCSRKAADGSGLFVKSIRGERNRRQDGWVYKVGHKLATAGAADPGGPFGAGRLRSGDDVVWFYCRQLSNGSCQRSLTIDTTVEGGTLSVTVTGYDDAGEGANVAGATVRVGDRHATTDDDGEATLKLDKGSHLVRATKQGAIRSFAKRVKVG
jgi:hypothetical protein